MVMGRGFELGGPKPPKANRCFRKPFVLLAAVPSKTVIAGPDGKQGMHAQVRPIQIETLHDFANFFNGLQSGQLLPVPDPVMQLFVILSEQANLLEDE